MEPGADDVHISTIAHCHHVRLFGCAQYRILRQKGTEPAGTGEYNKHKEDGVYKCAGCATPLYT